MTTTHLTELDIVTAAGSYWHGVTLAEILYSFACAVGPMPAWEKAGAYRRMFALTSERALELVNIALAVAAPAGEPPLRAGLVALLNEYEDDVAAAEAQARAALAAPAGEPDERKK